MLADPVNDYCDYLDKEMTTMGLFTAFAPNTTHARVPW